MKVASVKKVGRHPVYDITVKDIHHYVLRNGVVTHNTGGMYAANCVFIITKAQEKEGTEISGYKFTINIEKSRFVKEKAKFPFVVTYKKGIDRYSGLLELGMESGFVIKPKVGWYQKIDPETGEILEKNYREKDTHNLDFWRDILMSQAFRDFCTHKYKLGETVEIDDLNEEETSELTD